MAKNKLLFASNLLRMNFIYDSKLGVFKLETATFVSCKNASMKKIFLPVICFLK